jgi:hypothetical protein
MPCIDRIACTLGPRNIGGIQRSEHGTTTHQQTFQSRLYRRQFDTFTMAALMLSREARRLGLMHRPAVLYKRAMR